MTNAFPEMDEVYFAILRHMIEKAQNPNDNLETFDDEDLEMGALKYEIKIGIVKDIADFLTFSTTRISWTEDQSVIINKANVVYDWEHFRQNIL